MAKQLSRTWPTTVSIDGVDVTVRFTRMPVDAFFAWERQYMSYRDTGADADDALGRAEQMFAWVKQTLVDCLTLPDDELEVDGQPIRTGADLFEAFGTRVNLMMGLMNRVWLYHRFEDDVRKNLLSLFDSPATSVAPATEPVGLTPDRTAGSADSAGSVTTEDAGLVDALTVLPSGGTA